MNAPLLDAPKFETGRSDPRLAEYLKEFPPAIFSERLYQSIEVMERYSIELAVDLLGRLNLVEQLGAWRSAEELCSVLGFQPRFRLPLQWILTRLVETGCVEVQVTEGPDPIACGRRHGNLISDTCALSRSTLIPGTRRLWIC